MTASLAKFRLKAQDISREMSLEDSMSTEKGRDEILTEGIQCNSRFD